MFIRTSGKSAARRERRINEMIHRVCAPFNRRIISYDTELHLVGRVGAFMSWLAAK